MEQEYNVVRINDVSECLLRLTSSCCGSCLSNIELCLSRNLPLQERLALSAQFVANVVE